MPGFDYRGPIPQLSAEQIAQMGLAAFKPPAAMSMPGLSIPAPSSAGSSGLGEGLGLLGKGLGALAGSLNTNAGTNAINAMTVPYGSYTAGLGADGLGTLVNSGGFGSIGPTFFGFPR